MKRISWSLARCTTISLILFLAASSAASAQEEVLTGAFGNATDFNFFWTQVGSPKSGLRPERGGGAAGIGFELAFKIPGGFRRTLVAPRARSSTPEGADCRARFDRGELGQGVRCADTTVVGVKRTRSGHDVAFEEELKIEEFEWEVPLLSLGAAVGFSQTGAFISRRADQDTRVSLRESPSVSLYANYRPTLPVIGRLIGTYFGARTGLVSLINGIAFTESGNSKFSGETFQIGPVAGLVTQFRGINVFAEGVYMWRNFRSVVWDGDTAPGNLQHTLDFTGASLAIGLQFEFKSPEK